MKVQLSICIVAYNNYDDVAKAVSSLEEYTPSQIKKQVYDIRFRNHNSFQLASDYAVFNPEGVDDYLLSFLSTSIY